MVAHVESDPDKDTIQQPIHSIHKDEIGVRIPGAPPIFIPLKSKWPEILVFEIRYY